MKVLQASNLFVADRNTGIGNVFRNTLLAIATVPCPSLSQSELLYLSFTEGREEWLLGNTCHTFKNLCSHAKTRSILACRTVTWHLDRLQKSNCCPTSVFRSSSSLGFPCHARLRTESHIKRLKRKYGHESQRGSKPTTTLGVDQQKITALLCTEHTKQGL